MFADEALLRIAGILADVAASLFRILDVFWRRHADFKYDTILLLEDFDDALQPALKVLSYATE